MVQLSVNTLSFGFEEEEEELTEKSSIYKLCDAFHTHIWT